MVNCSGINSSFPPIMISLLETPIIEKVGKKRSASTFEEDDPIVGVGWVKYSSWVMWPNLWVESLMIHIYLFFTGMKFRQCSKSLEVRPFEVKISDVALLLWLCISVVNLWFALCNVYLNVDAADISKTMQAKRKRLECLTKSSLKGSNQKIEQLWKTQHSQRYMCTRCRCF